MNSQNSVRYNHEILPVKHAKPNQPTYFVRYNRVFVITVIVITEFDCTFTNMFFVAEDIARIMNIFSHSKFQLTTSYGKEAISKVFQFCNVKERVIKYFL